ncbi:hypothetical protein CO608_07895 [Lysobacteraceae bacterium NML08-0793]|nr:hypothetical protein CO608_07895 [Xanthomonadaceae bacterium NML08-0793]
MPLPVPEQASAPPQHSLYCPVMSHTFFVDQAAKAYASPEVLLLKCMLDGEAYAPEDEDHIDECDHDASDESPAQPLT